MWGGGGCLNCFHWAAGGHELRAAPSRASSLDGSKSACPLQLVVLLAPRFSGMLGNNIKLIQLKQQVMKYLVDQTWLLPEGNGVSGKSDAKRRSIKHILGVQSSAFALWTHIGFLGVLALAICAKAFWPPKSPETTPNPKFSRKSGFAPKSPRNSHWIHTKRHTEFHWISLNFPEISRNSPKSPKFHRIPEISAKSGEERNSRNQPPSRNAQHFLKLPEITWHFPKRA